MFTEIFHQMDHQIKNLLEYTNDYNKSITKPDEFWENIASSFLWRKRWEKTLDWNFETPKLEWFKNAKLNLTENIFERLLSTHRNKTAIIWEPNDPEISSIRISYGELYKQTCMFANAMKAQGIQKGDRVIIYMPMVPEATVAMLACARIGAIHSVVFAGFSASALADRNDCQAKMVLTSDGNFRGNKKIPVKSLVDEAITKTNTVEKVIVLKRTGQNVKMHSGRDLCGKKLLKGNLRII